MWSALVGLVWVVLVSAVALMPFPQHKPYAIAMLALFPVIIGLVAVEVGPLWAVLLFLAALSIYRYPAIFAARYVLKKLRRAL